MSTKYPTINTKHSKAFARSVPVIVMLSFIFFPEFVQAQPGFEEGVQEVPLDGGLSLLVAAGAAYGARRLRKKRYSTHVDTIR